MDNVEGTLCAHPFCEHRDKRIQKSYKCRHCRRYLHPSPLECSQSVGEDREIECLPENSSFCYEVAASAGFPDGNDCRNEADDDAVSNFAPQQDDDVDEVDEFAASAILQDDDDNNEGDDDLDGVNEFTGNAVGQDDEDYERDEDDADADADADNDDGADFDALGADADNDDGADFDALGAARETNGSDSAIRNLKSAKRRFGKFLHWLLKVYKPNDCEATAQRLFRKSAESLDECDIVWEAIKRENINIKDIDRFARWLFFFGKTLRGPGTHIKYKTADCDMTALIGELRREAMYDEKERLSKEKVAKIRKGMRNLFDRRCIENGEPLSESYKTSLESDLLRITMLCLWSNDVSMFSVAFFVAALCQFAGRATETARATFNRVTMRQPDEFKGNRLDADMIPHFRLWRIKGRREQELSVFNNRDIFLLCFPFLMFVSMMMQQEEQNDKKSALFPEFYSKAGRVLSQELTAGGLFHERFEDELLDGREEIGPAQRGPAQRANARNVSKFFKQCLNKLSTAAGVLDEHIKRAAENGDGNGNNEEGEHTFATDLSEETPAEAQMADHSFFGRITNTYGLYGFQFQKGLGCHSQKRYAVNEAFQTPHVSFTHKCQRMGWHHKSLHIVFHYAELSAAGDRECARILSRWNTTNSQGKLAGGRPPRLDCLWDIGPNVKDNVLRFVANLFDHYNDTPGAQNYHLQWYLTANFLCRLGDFLSFLAHDPLQRFGTTPEENFEKHSLLRAVNFAAGESNLTIENLINYGKVIEKDFHQRNFEWVTHDDLSRVGIVGDSTHRGDTGTIGTFMHAMTQHLGNLNTTVLEMKQQDRELKTSVLQLAQQMALNTQMLQQQQQQLNHLQQQQNQNTRMLQQILQLRGHGNAMADFEFSQLAEEQVAPALAPTEPTEAHADGISDVVESPALALPESLRNLHVQCVFRNWYLKGYHHLKSGTASVKSNVKMTVQYLNLFLDSHIEPMPDSRQAKDLWKDHVRKQTDDVWMKAKDWARDNGKKDLSSLVSSFKKFMCKIDQSKLPRGPEGLCHFQPKNESDKLLTWDRLQISRKRKAGEDEVAHSGSDADQAHESTQPSLSERREAELARVEHVRYYPQYGNGVDLTHQNIAARANERLPGHHPELSNFRERTPPRTTFAGFGVDEGHRGYSAASRPNPDMDDMDEL